MLEVQLIPVLFGEGCRLFDGLGPHHIELGSDEVSAESAEFGGDPDGRWPFECRAVCIRRRPVHHGSQVTRCAVWAQWTAAFVPEGADENLVRAEDVAGPGH